jgi:excisionase family DNA binding protein
MEPTQTIDKTQAVAAMGKFFEMLNGINGITVSADEYRRTMFKAVDAEITTPTVAEVLRVSSQTVLNMAKDGRLNPLNAGSSKLRFRLSEVLEYKLKKTID